MQKKYTNRSEPRSFANGIYMDIKAIINEYELDTSNWTVGDYVNKLKAIKRVMYWSEKKHNLLKNGSFYDEEKPLKPREDT